MVVPLCPVFHTYVPPPDAVSVALWPEQTEVLGGLTDAITEFTLTVNVELLEHVPLVRTFDTVTEYTVVTAGLTKTLSLVELVFHR